jgi:hypothetical protein
MTFIITSNTTENAGDTTSGLNDPVSYTNMLSSTFEIEPNSEIAVDSIKFTRNGNLSVSSENNKFAVFIGEDLNACGLTLQQSIGFPVMTEICGGDITRNPRDLIQNIDCGLHRGLAQHPNFTDIDGPHPQRTELKNGSGEFTGFKFNFTSEEEDTSNLAHIPAVEGQGGYVSTTLTDHNASISASGSRGVVIHKVNDVSASGECSVIGQKYPISWANGSVVFRYNSSLSGSAGAGWEVGLTRATINIGQADGGAHGRPWWYERGGGDQYDEGMGDDLEFFDYSIADIGGNLKVYNAGYDGAENGRGFYKREVALQGTHLTSAYVSVKFICLGNEVSIKGIKENGDEEDIVVNDGTKAQNNKPANISWFHMFPKVNIFDTHSASRIMVVEDYSGLKLQTPNGPIGELDTLDYQYGGRYDSGIKVDNDRALLGNILNGGLTYQDWWSYSFRSGNDGPCRDTEARPPFDINSTFDVGSIKLNASKQIDFTITLITSSDGLFNGRDTSFAGGYTRECGAQNILGFEKTPTQSIKTYDAINKLGVNSITSKTTPNMTSNKSLFVRLPELPVESYNTGKGSVSKIIHHIPRFDNSGNEVGGLFFKSNEKLYVPLHNVNKLRLNSMKVEICYIDETTNDVELVGTTIVCFDIRKRR